MIIDQDICIKIGDGELYFSNPGYRAYIILTGMEKTDEEKEADAKRSFEEKANELWQNLTDVKGFFYKDGKPVTKDTLLAGNHTVEFYNYAKNAYAKALVDILKGELVSQKNESTPDSSS